MSGSDNTPDFYTPEELADTFPGSRLISAMAIEVRDLARAIIAEVGKFALSDRFPQKVIDDIEAMTVPEDLLAECRERLYRVARDNQLPFLVTPAEAAIHEPREFKPPVVSDVTVRCTGGRVDVDDPRIADLRTRIEALSLEEADKVASLVRGVRRHGVSLSCMRATTELDVGLMAVIVLLAPYDDDVQQAILDRTTYNVDGDVCATLADMTFNDLRRFDAVHFDFVAGRLTLQYTSDGSALLALPNSNTKEKTNVK
jgi:hypothetical protein